MLALAIGGLATTSATAWWHHYHAGQLAKEVRQLRGSAQAEAERAAADREFLRQLDRELSEKTAELDRAASTGGDAKTAADRQAEITRLIAQREAAIDRALAEREQLAAERDEAFAERDAALAERRSILDGVDAATRATISQIQNIIRSTGLDPNRLIKVPTKEDRNAPRGGPFIPWGWHPSAANKTAPSGEAGNDLDELQAARDVLMHLPIASPVPSVEISSGFGWRHDPVTGWSGMHTGIDLRGPFATPIYATAAGTVTLAGWDADYGQMVEIDHGFGLVTHYAHLSKILVKVGQTVGLHQKLGLMGATGRATGVHLHYEVGVAGQLRDPVKFLKADHYVPEKEPVPSDRPSGAGDE